MTRIKSLLLGMIFLSAIIPAPLMAQTTSEKNVAACTEENSEKAAYAFAASIPGAVTEVTKDADLKNFKEAISRKTGIAVSELAEADTQVFIYQHGEPMGVIILINKGCVVALGRMPVSAYMELKDLAKGI